MLIRVIDFETTGLSPEGGGICEVGWTDVSHPVDGSGVTTIRSTREQLTDPGCVIGFEAMAVHHITNEMVAGEVLRAAEVLEVAHRANPADVYVAHNADFEQSWWPGPEGVPWVCTYKVALRTHPEAPRHSNQVLRYWLGLGADPERADPAHRAGPDTYVTALLFVELLRYASLEDMIRWSSGPALLPRVPFGKYRGAPWSGVPVDYLKWIVLSSDMDATIKANAKHELKRRESG